MEGLLNAMDIEESKVVGIVAVSLFLFAIIERKKNYFSAD